MARPSPENNEAKKEVKGRKEATPGQPPLNAQEREKAAEYLRVAIDQMKKKITGAGFDCTPAPCRTGVNSHDIYLMDRGTAAYMLSMNMDTRQFELRKVGLSADKIIGKSDSLRGLDLPVSTDGWIQLVRDIEQGSLDGKFGNTKFIMKAERLGNTKVTHFLTKGGLFGDDVPAFSLSDNTVTGMFTLTKATVSESGNSKMVTHEILGQGINPYTLINRNITKIVPGLEDRMKKAEWGAGGVCLTPPQMYPKKGLSY